MTQSWKLCLASWLAFGGAIASLGDCANGQITPDTTLGSENSHVTSTGAVDTINGGATRGANLFHSFQEFNVEEERAAVFTNPAGIENILSRVTGGNASNILGTLGVWGGNANLFLINPNGIIFGPNARLDVGGSFVTTTANAIGLANGDIFSANPREPLPTQLLNVKPNAFFFHQIAAQPIINRSTAGSTGLRVPQAQSLLLVGGHVRLEGGRILVPGGRVELAGVRGNGTAGLSVNGGDLGLSFPVGVQRADVSLTNGADVNVRAGGGGSIAINAQNLYLVEGSSLRAGINSGFGSIGSQAGDIEINATETINLTNESFIANSVRPRAVGKGGDIRITTGSLALTSGAQLSASTYGQGDAGSVTIGANDTVSLDGPSAILSRLEADAVGKGGSIDIQARSLTLTNGAQLIAITEGQGNAGSVTIRASDMVSFDGVGSNGLPSAAGSSVEADAVGKGGSIDIQAHSLALTNGARLVASTVGQGDAGSVTIRASDTVSLDGPSAILSRVEADAVGKGGSIDIQARSLTLTNGAQLSASTYGQGDAGSVTVHASDMVSLDGMENNGFSSAALSRVGAGAEGNGGGINIQARSLALTNGAQLVAVTEGQGDAGSVTIRASDTVSFDGVGSNGFPSAAGSSVEADAVGKGGVINIKTGLLSVTNGAGLIASSEGSGAAGDIAVAARSVRLDNQALLRSNTITGQGNIFLRSGDLLLRRGSNITTNATGTATGGNITIDTDILVALENSDISANAEEAFGGRVIIDAQGIFGTQFREYETPQSDITATSELGPDFSGIVDINTPDIDPSQGLVSLPAVPVDTEVAQACTPGGSQQQSEFVVTGRGGLPPTPTEALSSDAIQVDWVTLNPGSENSSSPEKATNPTAPEPAPIVEAQGWVLDANGEVVLTASAVPVLLHSSWQNPTECHASQSALRR